MGSSVSILIKTATSDRWEDFVLAFGSRASNPDSCWCQRFCARTESGNRVELQREVDTAAMFTTATTHDYAPTRRH